MIRIHNAGELTIRELRNSVIAALNENPTVNVQAVEKPAARRQLNSTLFGRELDETEQAKLAGVELHHLGLSTRPFRIAKQLPCGSALELARLARAEALRIVGCGKKSITEIRQALQAVLSDERQTLLEQPNVSELVDQMLASIPERHSFVLMERFGLWSGVEEVLEDIGSALGVGRERVRQIERAAINRLRHSPWGRMVRALIPTLADDAISQIGRGGVVARSDVQSLLHIAGPRPSQGSMTDSLRGQLALRFLMEVFEFGTSDLFANLTEGEDRWFDSDARRDQFERVELIARQFLQVRGKPVVPDQILSAIGAAGHSCSRSELERFAEVSNVIGTDVTGAIGLRRWKHFGSGSLAALMQRALQEIGEPAHYSRVSEIAVSLDQKRRQFTPTYVLSQMLRAPDVFQSLGRGIYALCDWGLSRPPLLKDFIVSALAERGGKGHKDEIADAGEKRYGFKRTSCFMILSMNPTFFRDEGHGWYSLR